VSPNVMSRLPKPDSCGTLAPIFVIMRKGYNRCWSMAMQKVSLADCPTHLEENTVTLLGIPTGGQDP